MGTPDFANQTMWSGDNLPIMRGMNSECIDLIYLDPPFNSKANYAAPDIEARRVDIPSLRSHHEPLPEIAYGRGLRTA